MASLRNFQLVAKFLLLLGFLVILSGATQSVHAQGGGSIPPPSPASLPPARPPPDWGTNSEVGKTPTDPQPAPSVPKSVRPIRMPATIQLAYVPSAESGIRGHTTDEIEYEHYKCVKALWELNRMRWHLMFSADRAWISAEPPYSDEVEIDYQGLVDLAREYINSYARLQEIRGELNALSMRDAYLNSLKVDRTGPYSISVRDESARASQARSSSARKATGPGYHEEAYIEYEKRLMIVGFDQNGNPIKKLDYDVVLYHRQVPD